MNSHRTLEGDLTVIVPIRCSNERQDAIQRLQFLLQAAPIPDAVQFLVVDDGSPRQVAKEIEAACDKLGLEYLRLESELETFSIGRARNAGVQHSRTKYVLFQDVDLLPYPGFYSDVLTEIEVQELHKYAERFLMFGVIYLTESGTNEFLSTPAAVRKSKFLQYLLDADVSRIEKFSTGTSVTVWRRDYFLGAGGNDPEFEGWGYEDLEFACRAIRRSRRFPLPDEFALDYKNFQTINEYRGWKSVYRLFGDITFQKGYVLFHAWHPVQEEGIYLKAKNRNRRLFEEKLERFRLRGEEPDPLPMPERGRSIIFRTNPWVYNRWTAPMLGEIIFADEDMFTPDSFVEYLRKLAVNRVVFHNPYANQRMHAIYERVKSLGIEYIVCERGALPGSVFFDPLGFNGESGSYNPSKWRRELSQEEVASLSAYVSQYKMTGDSLEDQPSRVGTQELKRKLGLAPGRKILFVPLQRPTDSVIEYLCGPIGSYDNFLRLIRRLVFCLPPEWVVVVKRHPLETESPDLPGVYAADQFHINDLISASDAILLINSGVGVLGLLYEKPVLYTGCAFYGHEGVSRLVVDEVEVLDAIRNFRPDIDLVRQFLYYLIFEFYSFAEFATRRVSWRDGSLMTATTAIEYRVIRMPQCPEVRFERRTEPLVGRSSILFDRYRGESRGNPKEAGLSKSMGKQPNAPQTSRGGALTEGLSGSSAPKPRRPVLIRKLIKLKNNPTMFFRDSRFRFLRWVGWSIQKS